MLNKFTIRKHRFPIVINNKHMCFLSKTNQTLSLSKDDNLIVDVDSSAKVKVNLEKRIDDLERELENMKNIFSEECRFSDFRATLVVVLIFTSIAITNGSRCHHK